MRRLLLCTLLALAACGTESKPQTPAQKAHSLMSDLAAHHQHGQEDVQVSYTQLDKRLRKGGDVSLPAGHISDLAIRRLERHGFRARKISLRAVDAPSGDPSHTLIEVWARGTWLTYDIDRNVQLFGFYGPDIESIFIPDDPTYGLSTGALAYDSYGVLAAEDTADTFEFYEKVMGVWNVDYETGAA